MRRSCEVIFDNNLQCSIVLSIRCPVGLPNISPPCPTPQPPPLFRLSPIPSASPGRALLPCESPTHFPDPPVARTQSHPVVPPDPPLLSQVSLLPQSYLLYQVSQVHHTFPSGPLTQPLHRLLRPSPRLPRDSSTPTVVPVPCRASGWSFMGHTIGLTPASTCPRTTLPLPLAD